MGELNDLQAAALTLRRLLEQYASHDPEVKEAYDWVSSLLNDVDSGSAVIPMKFPFGWIFLGVRIIFRHTLNYAERLLILRMHLNVRAHDKGVF